jgi:hypothetical protein
MELRQYWRHFRKDHDGNRQQRHGDGAQVWPFDWALDGVKYVMKGVERYAYTGEAQNYELAKFGLSDRITLSAGLLRHVDWQVRRGVPKTVKTLRQGEHSGPATATHDAAQFLQVGGMAGVTSVNARRAAWCEQTAGLFVKVA